MAMCSELGPEGGHYLQDYVLAAAGTSLCSIQAGYKGCNEKETKFIEIMAGKTGVEVASQVERLSKMKGSKMKDELKLWLDQRLAILGQFTQLHAKDEL